MELAGQTALAGPEQLGMQLQDEAALSWKESWRKGVRVQSGDVLCQSSSLPQKSLSTPATKIAFSVRTMVNILGN